MTVKQDDKKITLCASMEEKKQLIYHSDLRAHYTSEEKSSNYPAIKVLESVNKSVSCVVAYKNSGVDGVFVDWYS